MSERLAVLSLVVLTLVSLWVAPWAAFNRETGARGAVTLLPNRVIDFTGRTEAVDAPGQGALLLTSIAALLVIGGGSALRQRPRRYVWMAGGVALIVANAWGLEAYGGRFGELRLNAARQQLQEAVANPRSRYDLATLQELLVRAGEQPLEATVAEAREAGLAIRRLPYQEVSIGLAAFLCLATGGLAVLLGVRVHPRVDRWVQRTMDMAAVPLTSILLALLAAAVVVLALQETPMGSDVTITGPLMALAGRLDTLWFAYYTLFANSLGTFTGFMEALKFATPLIFTGLAVGFGFKAGLFNIGAPGQMVLGALAAMFVGVYMPGPMVLVLPAAVIASAVGGGLWGALPGWLKARFGAHEVINTILLNFIASSLLLFVLSSSPVFAASALRILSALGVASVALILLALIGPVRRAAGGAPRRAFALVGVVLLAVVLAAGWPQPGDGPVTLNLPFKAPGSEPKSVPLQETARLPQLPAVFGLDPQAMIGSQEVILDAALPVGVVTAVLALLLVARTRLRSWLARIGVALLVGGAAYGVGAALGWRRVPFDVPPSNLNVGFLIALAAALFMYVFLWRTRWGYELRAVGLAPKAAEFGGASIFHNTVLAMAISGAFAGMSATHYVLGGAMEEYSLRQSLPTNDGFDGIAVALLGANNPVGIVLAAFLFGVLKNGGAVLNITFPDLTRDVVNMILALVVLFIAARGFLPERFTDPIKRAAARGRRRREIGGEGSDAAAPPEGQG